MTEENEREWKVTKLPDDWRLSPSATRKRTLFNALSPSEQAHEVKRAAAESRRKAAKKKRRAILRSKRKKQ